MVMRKAQFGEVTYTMSQRLPGKKKVSMCVCARACVCVREHAQVCIHDRGRVGG